jgi:hypothetical protein
MGLFSWDCKKCGRSIRHWGSTTVVSRWMAQAVCLMPNGSVVIGTYDGYGRLDSAEGQTTVNRGEEHPCMYHKSCWELAGRPGYSGPSILAADQGHFVNDDPVDPKPDVG